MSISIDQSRVPSRTLPPADSPRLDALRSFAVLAVFADHFSKIWGSAGTDWKMLIELGRMGVLLFFVHTSLVLMFSLERQFQRTGSQRLWSSFMIRRIFRIYPLSILFVLAVFVFQIPSADITTREVQFRDVGLHGLGVNLALIQNLPKIGTDSIMGVLWSLPWEVQMYVALPVIFLIVRRWRSPWVLLGITAALFALFSVIHPAQHTPLMLFQYLPSFLSGVVAYRFWGTRRWRLPFWGFALVLAAITAFFMTYHGYLREAILGMAVGCAVAVARDPINPLLVRACQEIARYSYGFYLAHVLCIWLAFDAMQKQSLILQWLVFAVVLIGVPVMLYHAVERPMVRLGGRLATRWQQTEMLPLPRFWPRGVRSQTES